MATTLFLRNTPAPYQDLPINLNSPANPMSVDTSIWKKMSTEIGASETSVDTFSLPSSGSRLGIIGGWQSKPLQAIFISSGAFWLVRFGIAMLNVDTSNGGGIPGINFLFYLKRGTTAISIGSVSFAATTTQLKIIGTEYFVSVAMFPGDIDIIDNDLLLMYITWLGNNGQTRFFWDGDGIPNTTSPFFSPGKRIASHIQVPANLTFLGR